MVRSVLEDIAFVFFLASNPKTPWRLQDPNYPRISQNIIAQKWPSSKAMGLRRFEVKTVYLVARGVDSITKDLIL